MFYLSSKFHDNHVNTFGFMEGGGGGGRPGTPKSPGGIGLILEKYSSFWLAIH